MYYFWLEKVLVLVMETVRRDDKLVALSLLHILEILEGLGVSIYGGWCTLYGEQSSATANPLRSRTSEVVSDQIRGPPSC